MQDWKQLLLNIYTPDVGSIYAIPNKIWDNGFAKNKNEEDLHPSIIERYSDCQGIAYIIPGTSQVHNMGSCIFRVTLNISNPIKSYFILKLSMPIVKKELVNLTQGWNGVKYLIGDQLKDFHQQIKFCKG